MECPTVQFTQALFSMLGFPNYDTSTLLYIKDLQINFGKLKIFWAFKKKVHMNTQEICMELRQFSWRDLMTRSPISLCEERYSQHVFSVWVNITLSNVSCCWLSFHAAPRVFVHLRMLTPLLSTYSSQIQLLFSHLWCPIRRYLIHQLPHPSHITTGDSP